MAKTLESRIPEFVARHRDEIASLCQKHYVVRLELFGSAVTDSFDPERSDLDFLVDFDMTAQPANWLQIYFDFKESLEALFGRSIDLVSYRSVRNPHLIASIDQQRTLLYAA